jgi:putative endonuclease
MARDFLEQQGLSFICQNYRCRTGEIDLVMQDQEELVFVEVKFRSNSSHGSAIEYFHAKKRRKFESAVAHYMQDNALNPHMVAHRIDLLGIDNKQDGQHINWLKAV